MALLLVSVSSIALLTGCSMFDMKNPFKSERPEQVVPGERHPPLLNNAHSVAPNDVANESVSPMKQGNPARKPIPGNQPAAAAPAVSPAPAPAAPEQVFVPKTMLGSASSANVAPLPSVQAEAPKSAEKPSFFSRLFGTSSPTTDDNLPPPWKLRDEAGNTPVLDNATPALSSVPPVPPQFKTLKASREHQLQDMQSDHTRAMQQKNALDSEPSRQQETTQEGAPQPQITEPSGPRRGIDIMTQEEWDALMKKRQEKPAAPDSGSDAPGPQSDASPLQKLVEIAALFSPISDANAAEGEVIGEMKDGALSNVPSWAVVKAPENDTAKAASVPPVNPDKNVPLFGAAPAVAPETNTQTLATPTVPDAPKTDAIAVDAPEVPEKPSFFSRLFGSTEVQITPPADNSPATASETRAPQVVTPEVAAAAPVALPATQGSQLPSPKILEEVKMMSPSRYSARTPSQTLNPPSN